MTEYTVMGVLITIGIIFGRYFLTEIELYLVNKKIGSYNEVDEI